MHTVAEVSLLYVTETDDAVRFTQGDIEDERSEGFWIPKRFLQCEEGLTRGDCSDVMIAEWLAIKEGLV